MLTCPPATPSTYQTAHQPTTKPVTAKAMVRTGTGKTTGEAAVIGGDKGGRHVFCHGASATTTFATSQAPAKAMVKSATVKATAEATSNSGGKGDRLSHCRGADATQNAASDRAANDSTKATGLALTAVEAAGLALTLVPAPTKQLLVSGQVVESGECWQW